MTMPLAFALCVLASKALGDVWFKGSIFARGRAWGELYRDEGKWWVTQKFGELISCRFCFSYHTALWVSLFCIPLLPYWIIPVWWLAVRTATGFLDLLEEKLDGQAETSDAPRADDGAHAPVNSTSLFD